MKCGICVSTGSACNSGSDAPSHVLVSIGTPGEYIDGSLRTTFGECNTKADIDFLVDNLERIVKELRE